MSFTYKPVSLEEYNQSLRDSVNAYYTYAMHDPGMSKEDALKSTGEMADKYLGAIEEFQEAQNAAPAETASVTEAPSAMETSSAAEPSSAMAAEVDNGPGTGPEGGTSPDVSEDPDGLDDGEGCDDGMDP